MLAITTASGSAASGVQVFSLALSVTSIVSKAYVASVSCDLSVSAAKFAMIAYDIFALFYVFAAIVAPGPAEARVPFVPGVELTTFAAVWFWKGAVVAGLTAAASAVSGVILFVSAREDFLSRPPGRCNRAKDVAELLAGCCVVVLLWALVFVPSLVVAEATKLTLIVVFISATEPEHSVAAFCSRVFGFLKDARREGSRAELHDRVRHVNLFLADALPPQIEARAAALLGRAERQRGTEKRRAELAKDRDRAVERCRRVRELVTTCPDCTPGDVARLRRELWKDDSGIGVGGLKEVVLARRGARRGAPRCSPASRPSSTPSRASGRTTRRARCRCSASRGWAPPVAPWPPSARASPGTSPSSTPPTSSRSAARSWCSTPAR